MIDEEFIKRCEDLFEQERERLHQIELDRIRKWNDENREFLRDCQKKYEKTEKGKYAVSKSQYIRRKKFEDACEDLTNHEKRLIGKFYLDCPEGYEVDHIIPIAKGGQHRLSNLQYLTKEENRKKSDFYDGEVLCKIYEYSYKDTRNKLKQKTLVRYTTKTEISKGLSLEDYVASVRKDYDLVLRCNVRMKGRDLDELENEE